MISTYITIYNYTSRWIFINGMIFYVVCETIKAYESRFSRFMKVCFTVFLVQAAHSVLDSTVC